ncbi:DNA ligase [Haematococcus lacustris]|uniref:DNA ligase n=1 Tax=Haematococcus lacustris TaxID=44745 RepID=A0A699YAG4_HAELA|nr:DNA ligase [Haematococcus lacustris]
MLKRLDGPGSSYQPSKRSDSWVKLKADYCEGLRDTLDLVVIGAWHGSGRKVMPDNAPRTTTARTASHPPPRLHVRPPCLRPFTTSLAAA